MGILGHAGGAGGFAPATGFDQQATEALFLVATHPGIHRIGVTGFVEAPQRDLAGRHATGDLEDCSRSLANVGPFGISSCELEFASLLAGEDKREWFCHGCYLQ